MRNMRFSLTVLSLIVLTFWNVNVICVPEDLHERNVNIQKLQFSVEKSIPIYHESKLLQDEWILKGSQSDNIGPISPGGVGLIALILFFALVLLIMICCFPCVVITCPWSCPFLSFIDITIFVLVYLRLRVVARQRSDELTKDDVYLNIFSFLCLLFGVLLLIYIILTSIFGAIFFVLFYFPFFVCYIFTIIAIVNPLVLFIVPVGVKIGIVFFSSNENDDNEAVEEQHPQTVVDLPQQEQQQENEEEKHKDSIKFSSETTVVEYHSDIKDHEKEQESSPTSVSFSDDVLVHEYNDGDQIGTEI